MTGSRSSLESRVLQDHIEMRALEDLKDGKARDEY